MVEMITGMPPGKRVVLFAGKPLPTSGTVAAAGIRQGDLIAVEPNSNPFAINQDGSAADADAFIAALRQNAGALQQLSSRSPALQAAVASGNTGQLQAALRDVCYSLHRLPFLLTHACHQPSLERASITGLLACKRSSLSMLL